MTMPPRRRVFSQQLRVEVGPPQASLSLWIVDPVAAAKPRATVLVLHGIRGHKKSMLSAGQELARAGFRAVLVDSRGHGRSSGDRLGYGAFESRDLVQVLDSLQERGLLAGNVGAYGCSYGGATAISLAGRDERLKAVVAVTTFSSMRDQVMHYARRWGWALWVKLLPDWALDDAIQRAGRLAEFDPHEANPVDAIRRSKAQVLLIHGLADDFIPPNTAGACRPPPPIKPSCCCSTAKITGPSSTKAARSSPTAPSRGLSAGCRPT